MALKNIFYYLCGIVFLALAKLKNVLMGYSSPKPFDVSEAEKCIDYDIGVVDHWLRQLADYTKGEYSIVGKSVLELGPGSDLGIGLYLVSKGCSQYNACDVNNLVATVPESFYDKFLARLAATSAEVDIPALAEQLKNARTGQPSKLRYVVRDDFNIVSAFGRSSIDLVFSQAAFEHFDDIEATVSQLSEVCKPGAVLVIEIDLMTHSRWIREKDPNNIYRYPGYIYNMFWFRGIPNRVRPLQYKAAFERFGWTDITITPLRKIEDREQAYSGMAKDFTDGESQMEYLTVMLCARKQ
ncbi:MAG: class I SAM-dependent methyltransferase [Methylococcaceae bacterium]|nr:class I SAM-dependent methyltransferase [Methylococcaceae bacterium]